jgi:hypothetical protein
MLGFYAPSNLRGVVLCNNSLPFNFTVVEEEGLSMVHRVPMKANIRQEEKLASILFKKNPSVDDF